MRLWGFNCRSLIILSCLLLCHGEYIVRSLGKFGNVTHAVHFQERKLQLAHPGADIVLEPAVAHVLKSYLSNEELVQHMRNISERCSHVSRMFSIGKSSKGLDLWGLEISLTAGMKDAKPNVKYVANMHGDEPTGRQLLLALAEWLCASYKIDERARRFVDDMHLYLLPTINPDGFAVRTRNNAGGVDLNRDFPDPILRGAQGLKPSQTEQPESLAIMAWAEEIHFVSSGSLHEGAIVANYPYDGTQDKETHYEACPDDATFVHLARTYASKHAAMNASSEFKGGITNGAQWYPVWGGMQDWMYLQAKCLELTLELSQNKWPPPETLPQLFKDNLPALLAFHLEAAFGGVRGFVIEENPKGSGRPVPAMVEVVGINFTIPASAEFGDYYRPLAPGDWTLRATSPGYEPALAHVKVPLDGSGVYLNFTLVPVTGAAPLRQDQKPHSAGGVERAGASLDQKPHFAGGVERAAGASLDHSSAVGASKGPVLRSRLPGGILGVAGGWSKTVQSIVLIGAGLAVIQVVRTGLSWGSQRRGAQR